MSPENPRILAVDDTPDNLYLLEAILSSENYELSCVNDGELALESVSKSPPDLILLDLMMPRVSGYEVLRRIRQNVQLPRIPILLITADREISPQQGSAAGADGILYKPFDISKLLGLIRSLLP